MGCIFVCWRENDIPVISPGDENIALEVTVTNIGGDDAHQSQLSVTFPEFLRLSSVELKKSSVSVPFYWNPKKSKLFLFHFFVILDESDYVLLFTIKQAHLYQALLHMHLNLLHPKKTECWILSGVSSSKQLCKVFPTVLN